jgi:HK97 family phage prohead protease
MLARRAVPKMANYKDKLLSARREFKPRFVAAYSKIIRFQADQFLELARISNIDLLMQEARNPGGAFDKIEEFAAEKLRPVIEAYADVVIENSESVLEDGARALARGLSKRILEEIKRGSVVRAARLARNLAVRDYQDAVTYGGEEFALQEFEKIMETWYAADDLKGGREVIQADGDIARQIWISSGVTKIVWNISGDTCDACTSLDGRVVGLEGGGAFLSQGENTQQDEQGENKTQGKIWAGSDVLHPPLHAGCDCYITPVSGFRAKGMDMEKEKRVAGIIGAETRDGDDPDAMIVYGYAAVFNSRTEIRKGQFEQIEPGTFTRTLAAGADVRLNFNHDPSQILARTESGSLTLWEDDHGLGYRGELNPDDPQAVSIYAKIKRGDVSASSFMFDIKDEAVEDVDGGRLFKIRDVDLYDVAPVTFPAYDTATVSARTIQRRMNIDETSNQRASPGIVPKTQFKKDNLDRKQKEHDERTQNNE